MHGPVSVCLSGYHQHRTTHELENGRACSKEYFGMYNFSGSPKGHNNGNIDSPLDKNLCLHVTRIHNDRNDRLLVDILDAENEQTHQVP